jgi:hypothetical protein
MSFQKEDGTSPVALIPLDRKEHAGIKHGTKKSLIRILVSGLELVVKSSNFFQLRHYDLNQNFLHQVNSSVFIF